MMMKARQEADETMAKRQESSARRPKEFGRDPRSWTTSSDEGRRI